MYLQKSNFWGEGKKNLCMEITVTWFYSMSCLPVCHEILIQCKEQLVVSIYVKEQNMTNRDSISSISDNFDVWWCTEGHNKKWMPKCSSWIGTNTLKSCYCFTLNSKWLSEESKLQMMSLTKTLWYQEDHKYHYHSTVKCK